MKFSVIAKRAVWGKNPRQTLRRALILSIACFVVFGFFLLPARVEGDSMEPVFYCGSIIFINTLRYRFSEPRRGDIVAIRLAGRRVLLLKRVVGLPGERLAFREGILIINGEPFPEPYLQPCLKRRPRWNIPEVKMGPDEFFVVGDNHWIPPAVHYHGRVKGYRIVGGPLF